MSKYEPNFFVPCDKLRDISTNPVLCKEEPLGAGVLAANFLDGFLTSEQKDLIVLSQNKAQILPGKLQEKVKISALINGTLMLKANSSVWRAEINAIKTEVVMACNKILGKTAVKTVRIG